MKSKTGDGRQKKENVRREAETRRVTGQPCEQLGISLIVSRWNANVVSVGEALKG